MAIRVARRALGRIFFQRCFYLFFVLLAFVGIVPFIDPTPAGRVATALLNALIVVAAVAAVGRTVLSFVVALLLAGPALYFHWLGVTAGDSTSVALSWAFGAALYAATILYLLLYVFQPEVMTADKLYGAAAVYLLIGALWAHLYALVDHFYPGSFSATASLTSRKVVDLLYFSYTVLTSTGFGDIAPLTPQARAVCVIEQLIGALFVAILIARLAGVYPPSRRRDGD
jgi:hypothetical protein